MKRKRRNSLKPISKLQKLQNGSKEECESPFELLLRNPGYHFILEQICENLNSNDLAKCHRVSKRFHIYLNHNKQWWIAQLRFIRKSPKTFTDWSKEDKPKKLDTIEDKFPEWQVVFDYFESKAPTSILKTLVRFMKKYHLDVKVDTSPIFDAIMKRKTSIAKLLLQSPIDIYEREGRFNVTILHYACSYGTVTVVKLLLERDLDVNSTDKWGYTPLHYACQYGHLNIVKLLLMHPQADYRIVSNHGSNLIHCAAKYSQSPQLLRYLVANCNDLDINARDSIGNTVAHRVCQNGHIASMEYLMKLGTVNFQVPNDSGWTPLCFACRAPTNYKLTSKLLKHIPPESVNAPKNDGWTSLHIACRFGTKTIGNVQLYFIL